MLYSTSVAVSSVPNDKIVIGAVQGNAVRGRKGDHTVGRLCVVIKRLGKRIEHAGFSGARQEGAGSSARGKPSANPVTT